MIAKPNQQPMQLILDKDLHRQFKVRCAELGKTMNEQIALLIRAWLRRKQ